jgi:hypothetical protein
MSLDTGSTTSMYLVEDACHHLSTSRNSDEIFQNPSSVDPRSALRLRI